MKTNKKCEHCGEHILGYSYAKTISQGQVHGQKPEPVKTYGCQNFKECQIYNQ